MTANGSVTKTESVGPNDAPERDDAFFERADQFQGPTPVRRGRPPGRTKAATTLRVDADVLTALKASGPGWQTRVNDLLRAALACMKPG